MNINMNSGITYIVLIALIMLFVFLHYIVQKYYQCSQGINRRLIKLWVHHLLYTRLVVMAFFNGDDSLKFMMDRLMKNQHDIGNLLGEQFGAPVGQKMTNLLTEHIKIAGNVLRAVKSNNKTDQDKQIAAFYKNANDIGLSLDQLMNTNKFVHHMKMHIKTLVDDVIAYVGKKHDEDIHALDAYVNAGMDMALDMA